MRKLVEQPFWLDASDPARMRAAIQILTRPHFDFDPQEYGTTSGDHLRFSRKMSRGKAVHRVAAEGVTPDQAVDEAIARIKQILA